MTDLITAHTAHTKAAGLARTTITDREELLRRVDRDLPMGLERATVEELAGWLAHDPWSVQTKATYYGHIRAFFAWACNPRSPHLDWDPSAGLTRPRVPATLPKPVTDTELAYAIDHSGPELRRLILLAAYAGLRCCELADIDRKDVSAARLVVTGKGGKTRSIPTANVVWVSVRDLPAGPLAGGRTPTQVTNLGFQHMRRIGLRDVTFHRFRHWFGTNLLRHGADLRTVQELMGHASPATTAIYTQITDEQRQIAIAALPVLVPATT